MAQGKQSDSDILGDGVAKLQEVYGIHFHKAIRSTGRGCYGITNCAPEQEEGCKGIEAAHAEMWDLLTSLDGEDLGFTKVVIQDGIYKLTLEKI